MAYIVAVPGEGAYGPFEEHWKAVEFRTTARMDGRTTFIYTLHTPPAPKSLEEQVREALEELAAKDIADYLQRQGIKGVPGDPGACPVTRYLRAKFPGADITSNQRYVSIDASVIDMPKAVGEFIRSFDEIGGLVDRGGQ